MININNRFIIYELIFFYYIITFLLPIVLLIFYELIRMMYNNFKKYKNIYIVNYIKGNIYICVICLDNIDNIIYKYNCNCNYYYHKKCIDNWLYYNNICPICKIN